MRNEAALKKHRVSWELMFQSKNKKEKSTRPDLKFVAHLCLWEQAPSAMPVLPKKVSLSGVAVDLLVSTDFA